jgi:RHS repeat-associated protein
MKRGGSIAFTYDGQDVILDQKSDGSTTTYVSGPGIDNKLKQTSSTSGTHLYLQDHLGSTTALTDATGNISTQMSYDAYGNSTSNSLTRYGYTGRELDADTGLMYYRARWYDPQLGRFISEDPIGFSGGDVNLYGYVANSPEGRIDPTGLAWLHYWPSRIWRDRHGNVVDSSPYGHISLQLDDGTYISYWPGTHIGKKDVGKCVKPFPNRTYIDDYYGEHRTDSLMFYIPGLNEEAIKKWWNNGKGHGDWCSGNNCADIVEDALREGGFDVPSENWIWATPYDVLMGAKRRVKECKAGCPSEPKTDWNKKPWGGTGRGW